MHIDEVLRTRWCFEPMRQKLCWQNYISLCCSCPQRWVIADTSCSMSIWYSCFWNHKVFNLALHCSPCYWDLLTAFVHASISSAMAEPGYDICKRSYVCVHMCRCGEPLRSNRPLRCVKIIDFLSWLQLIDCPV